MRSPRRWVARFSTSFFSAVESHVREPNAAAAHLWDDLRSLKGVSVHFNSPGAAAALRAGLEREEKLSKAGRRRRAPTDRAELFQGPPPPRLRASAHVAPPNS